MKNPAPRPLGNLLSMVTGAESPPAAEALPIHGLAVDSRRVQPGDLFVAICGLRVDSHTYLGDAVRRGAVAAAVEREVEDAGVPLIRVADGRRALAELAAEWYGRPAERLPLVGITGSFGKTTVLLMLEAILRAAGRQTRAIGSELVVGKHEEVAALVANLLSQGHEPEQEENGKWRVADPAGTVVRIAGEGESV